MATVNIEIDGRVLEVESGKTIMDAANAVGIVIPHFCYHKKLSIAANCRMCLVQVEKAPKPMPACATPVTDGMKVQTRSVYAIKAQKSVMEFLLINHPLDCPICDQGGECTLQDLAVGYGASSSRYQEIKRVVTEKDLGPLIATDMTRCIHCSRCVRFGQEIAGIMELGMPGRGEHTEVMPFLQTQVASELSGNVIDLCPVGALTSKPFRYTARTWELSRRRSISPHDSLGSNLEVHVKDNKVMRVLPADNEDVNECWLADRDRFSYEGLNTAERLTLPMIKENGQWIETDWQVALDFVAQKLKTIPAEKIGALSTPYRPAEELYLLQKLVRGLGCGNVDHRLRQSDFSLDGKAKGGFWLGMPVTDMSRMNRMLVVGSNLRKDHPLMAHRIRESVRWGGQLNLINAAEDEFLGKVQNKRIVAPSQLASSLAGVCRALAELKNTAVPAIAAQGVVDDSARAMAQSLASGERKAVFLGNMAQHHPGYAQIHVTAQALASLAGASFGVLGEAANSVGAVAVGAVPHRGALGAPAIAGLNAQQMLAKPLSAYLLLGVEVELDTHDPVSAMKSIEGADFVVVMSPYKGRSLDYADVLLPIAPWTETSGTFVNTEGRVQSFQAVVKPLGETRPAWKVLRVLGNMLGLAGFDQNSSADVLKEALGDTPIGTVQAFADNEVGEIVFAPSVPSTSLECTELERVAEVPIYQTDAVVRRSPSLQMTTDAALPVARMHSRLIARLGLEENGRVSVRQTGSALTLKVERDDLLPDNCVRVPSGHPLTATLGPMFGPITAERA